ncbi:hypothetical protein OsI_30841 [Oryza sativa Indica Group]|uniref:Uncharacterized protein n=1 Tax=Oryza sativa subsp. indica TaxID=39946 RepID=B8BE94_ORYSI|nr:hypothetical protein OsI_30841 [Oryza sativa Indica Group]
MASAPASRSSAPSCHSHVCGAGDAGWRGDAEQEQQQQQQDVVVVVAGSGVAAVGAPTSAPRCAACVGTGREECRLCTRWSDSRGDCSVRRCGGRSAGATAGQAPDTALPSASPPRHHGDRVDRKLLL